MGTVKDAGKEGRNIRGEGQARSKPVLLVSGGHESVYKPGENKMEKVSQKRMRRHGPRAPAGT